MISLPCEQALYKEIDHLVKDFFGFFNGCPFGFSIIRYNIIDP